VTCVTLKTDVNITVFSSELLSGSSAYLAGILGEEINYLLFSILIIYCLVLSAVIRGRDGMDGGKATSMTLPFSEVPSEMMPGLQDAAGPIGLGFSKKKDVYY
jgi:hypothetical protein